MFKIDAFFISHDKQIEQVYLSAFSPFTGYLTGFLSRGFNQHSDQIHVTGLHYKKVPGMNSRLDPFSV